MLDRALGYGPELTRLVYKYAPDFRHVTFDFNNLVPPPPPWKLTTFAGAEAATIREELAAKVSAITVAFRVTEPDGRGVIDILPDPTPGEFTPEQWKVIADYALDNYLSAGDSNAGYDELKGGIKDIRRVQFLALPCKEDLLLLAESETIRAWLNTIYPHFRVEFSTARADGRGVMAILPDPAAGEFDETEFEWLTNFMSDCRLGLPAGPEIKYGEHKAGIRGIRKLRLVLFQQNLSDLSAAEAQAIQTVFAGHLPGVRIEFRDQVVDILPAAGEFTEDEFTWIRTYMTDHNLVPPTLEPLYTPHAFAQLRRGIFDIRKLDDGDSYLVPFDQLVDPTKRNEDEEFTFIGFSGPGQMVSGNLADLLAGDLPGSA